MTGECFPLNLSSHVFDAFCDSMDQQFIYICDIQSNVWRWSPDAVEYFGLLGEIVDHFPEIWTEKVHPEDRRHFNDAVSTLFVEGVKQHNCEYRVKKADGQYIWVLCRGSTVSNENTGGEVCVGALTHLSKNSKFDSVTGLLSRHEFRSALDELTGRQNTACGILLIGLDFFRRLNETTNYSFGNATLNQYGKKLSELCGQQYRLFRMEGDKFAMICPGAGADDLERLFADASAAAQRHVWVDGVHVPFTITGGAVLYPENHFEGDELYTSMEYALEYAKKHNREQMTFFTLQLQKETMQQFLLGQKLKESIDNDFGGFYVCYQPTVTPDDEHALVGVEALLRWHHADLGSIPPATFIPILEESGKIVAVGKWVFTTALRQVKKWLAFKPNMKVSVNVSLLQFQDDEFRQFVLDEIEACDFPKRQLILELTESCNVLQPGKIREELNFFRKHGIQIALDDFGTGYASLSILRDLAADWIKVDHSFVAQIAYNDYDQALTESLINLCKRLNLNVCVEGIETEEIQSIIQGYEPAMMQGYLYSKPLITEQFEEQYIKHA